MKKNIYGFLVLLLFILGMISIPMKSIIVQAASAGLSFSKDKEDILVGNSFVVTVTVESTAEFKDFQTYIAYDPQMLELIDTGNYVTGSEGLVFISDINGKISNVHQYRMKFRALKSGKSEIYVSDNVYIYEANTAQEMSVSKGAMEVEVAAVHVQEQNQNQGLGSLSVGEGTLNPAFKSDVTEYQVEVSSKTETLFIDAKAKLKAYQIDIEGNTRLKEGQNIAKVIVKDANNSQKIYTIYIHKKSNEEEILDQEEHQVEAEDQEESGLKVIKEDEGIMLKTSNYFRVVPVPENSVIPGGYTEEKIRIKGNSVIVYAPAKNLKSNQVLLYGMMEGKEEIGAAFYIFDQKEQSLSKFVENEEKISISSTEENYQRQIKNLYIFIFVLILCLLGMLMALLHLYVKSDQGYEEKNEEIEEDEDESWD